MSLTADIASWMDKNDGGVAECARCLGVPKATVKTVWKRIRQRRDTEENQVRSMARWQQDRIEAESNSAALLEAQHLAGQLDKDSPEKRRLTFAEQLDLLKAGKGRLVSNVIPRPSLNCPLSGGSSLA